MNQLMNILINYKSIEKWQDLSSNEQNSRIGNSQNIVNYHRKQILYLFNKINNKSNNKNYMESFSENLHLALRIQDLNSIIKHFSYKIQDRFNQFNQHFFPAKKSYSFDENQIQIIEKYAHYKIEQSREIRYIKKFCQRIIQIFSYYKTQSKNSDYFTSLEQKIISDMDSILAKVPLPFFELVTYIYNIARKPLVNDKKKKITQLVGYKQKKVSSEYPKTRNNLSTSNLNIKKVQDKKSRSSLHKRLRLYDHEQYKLYNILNLDKNYIQRYVQNINLFQKEAADKLSRQMHKKNEKINQDILNFARKYNNMRKRDITELNEQIIIENQFNEEDQKLNSEKQNILKQQIIKKNQINECEKIQIKSKFMSKSKKESVLTNNWLPKKQYPKRINQDRQIIEQQVCIINNTNYNFCIKQSLKFQNRKLRKISKENEPIQALIMPRSKLSQKIQSKSLMEACSTILDKKDRGQQIFVQGRLKLLI